MPGRAGPPAANRFPSPRDIAIVATLFPAEARMRALFFWLLLMAPALAQEAAPGVPSTTVKLDGAVKSPATYSLMDLAALSSASVTLTVQGHDAGSGSWKGVPLMALIQ